LFVPPSKAEFSFLICRCFVVLKTPFAVIIINLLDSDKHNGGYSIMSNGFSNEDNILAALDNKRFSTLNNNLQQLLKFSFDRDITGDTEIICEEKAGLNKSDLIIKIEEITKTLSVKIGAGNSVHQEPVNEFISFLENIYEINEALSNDIRFFIWGDGTLNNTGDKSDRLKANQLKEQYPDIIDRIKSFFCENKQDLIERFVIEGGPKSSSSPDIIYHGNQDNGYWERADEVLRWLSDDANESRGVIPVGGLTFQAWNRNIHGGSSSELKRGHIQLKWPTVGEDLRTMAETRNE
jgi:hypothetical protein